MANEICMNCFRRKGTFEVCPHCGFVEGTPPEQAYHLHPGVTLSGRYIVGTVSGFGGFGTIYKSWDSQLGTIVAIKEFYPAGFVSRIPGTKEVVVFSGDKKDSYMLAKQRFLSEAKTLAMFNKNPNIVNVYNFFEENNTAYIVMEYLDGIPLRDYLIQKGGKLPVDEALEIVRPVMEALIAIHARGIIHRDIHPGNIFITTNNKIKLLDFGAARLSTGEDEATLTVVVTQGYTSPEQYRTKSKQGPFTDVYGLGATLYKMITGVLPEESLDRQVNDTLKKPSEAGLKLSDNLNKSIMKAMALKPDIRFQKVADFRDAVFKNSKVDFPEVEFKRRRRRRGILISAVMTLLVAMLITVGLYSTVLKPIETLESIEIAEDTITVWLPVSGDEAEQTLQTDNFRDIVDAFTSSKDKNGVDNSQITIKIEPIAADDYGEKLIQSAKDGDLPTLYRVDGAEDLLAENSAPLGIVKASINTKEEYLFLNDYDTLFPAGKTMPTGWNAAVLYGNNQSSKNLAQEIPASITDRDTMFHNKNLFEIKPEMFDLWLKLYGEKLIVNDKGSQGHKINIDEDLIQSLVELKNRYNSQDTNINEDVFATLAGEQILYLFSDTQDLRTVQATLPGYYSVVDIEYKGRIAGAFTNLWGVSGNATENRQFAAMKFLTFLLSDYTQDQMYLQQDGAIPLNKEIFGEYLALNPDFAFLEDKVNIVDFAGEDAPMLRQFAKDVFDNVLTMNVTEAQLREYLENYGKEGSE